MFNNLKDNKKKVMTAGVSLILVAAIIAGIASAVRSTTSSTVAVVPVSDLNYGYYLDWQNSVSGMITTQAEQHIYLSDTEKVQDVLVQEGQPVRRGDVLLRYDTRATELKLEKEKLNRERIELGITVAKENIKTLENTSPTSEGGDFDLAWDFAEFDQVDVLSKAEVYEHILTADAKPVRDDPEDVFLGEEDTPYVFLCKGGTVVITGDFIKKWQKAAEKKESGHLYIALQVRDDAQALQKAWITDIMLLDQMYDIEVDLATGKTSYAAMNKPEELALLLRKILKEIPDPERGEWLAAMLDKLMITDEMEEKKQERGSLLASMLNALSEQDREEFASAAALMDSKTLSVLFESLSANLTAEQVEEIDQDAMSAIITLLLGNVTREQVGEIDSDVLALFLQKLSSDQISELEPEIISAILASLSEEQIRGLDQAFLARLFTDMTEEQVSGLDVNEMKRFFDCLTEEQLKMLIEARKREIEELLNKSTEEEHEETGEGHESSEPVPSDDSGNNATQDEPEVPEKPQEEQAEQPEPEPGKEEPTEQPESESMSDENISETGLVPPTAPAPGTGTGSGIQILSGEISYTSRELAKAKREAREKLRDLELDLKESKIKIEKAESALERGVITASMDGVIKTAGDPNAPPTDGSAFITVTGTEGLYVKSGIKESKLGTIREGDTVTVTSWQTGGQYEAQIKSISPYPDSTGMFYDGGTETFYPFMAAVSEKKANLTNGEWVEVSYTSSNPNGGSNALTVLKAFIREEDGRKYVYKRDVDMKLKKQYIVTGTLSDSGYEVLDGLSANDWIAFPYGKNVKDGAKTREASVYELY